MTRRFFDWHPKMNVLARKSDMDVKTYADEWSTPLPKSTRKTGFVEIDNVAEYVLSNKESKWGIDDAPVKAPWKITWAEFLIPDICDEFECATVFDQLVGDHYIGAYILCQDVEKEDRRQVLEEDFGAGLAGFTDENLMFDPGDYLDYAERTGRGAFMRGLAQKYECYTTQSLFIFLANRRNYELIGKMALYLDERGYVIDESSFLASEQGVDIAYTMTTPILMALALLNCKNVETKDCPNSQTQIKKFRKHGSPVITRKTLVIHPGGTKSKSDGADTDQKRSWHMCRGHFKTFTEDAPLFGRVTGTYWWQPQLRGSKSVGEVHKDYKVEPK